MSSVLLWSPVFRDQQASALFQRLQLDPLLLLQLLALLLLWATLYKREVLLPAFAGILPGARRRGGFSQIVIDTSSVIDGRIETDGRSLVRDYTFAAGIAKINVAIVEGVDPIRKRRVIGVR